MVKRTPIVRKVPLVRRTPPARSAMATRTARLAASGRALIAAQALVWTRDEGRCVVCGGRGDQIHHRQPRGMGGASRRGDVHSPSRLIAVCRDCHGWIESYRLDAQRSGYLVRRGPVPPADVPLLHRGRWVLLDDRGGLTELVPEIGGAA